MPEGGDTGASYSGSQTDFFRLRTFLAMPVNWDGEIEKWMEMRGLRYEKYGEYLI